MYWEIVLFRFGKRLKGSDPLIVRDGGGAYLARAWSKTISRESGQTAFLSLPDVLKVLLPVLAIEPLTLRPRRPFPRSETGVVSTVNDAGGTDDIREEDTVYETRDRWRRYGLDFDSS